MISDHELSRHFLGLGWGWGGWFGVFKPVYYATANANTHANKHTARARRPCVPETLRTHRPCTRCSCTSRFSRAHTVTRHSHIVGHTPVRNDIWADCGTWVSCPYICCVCTLPCQNDQNPTVVMVNLHWRSTHQNPAVLASACSGLSRQTCSTEDQ